MSKTFQCVKFMRNLFKLSWKASREENSHAHTHPQLPPFEPRFQEKLGINLGHHLHHSKLTIATQEAHFISPSLSLKMRIFLLASLLMKLDPPTLQSCLAMPNGLAHEPTLSSRYSNQNFIFPTSFNGKLGYLLPNLPQITYVASFSYGNQLPSLNYLN